MSVRPPPRFNPADGTNRPRRMPPTGGTLPGGAGPSPPTGGAPGAGPPPPSLRDNRSQILSPQSDPPTSARGPPPPAPRGDAPAPVPRNPPPPLAPRDSESKPAPPPISRDERPTPVPREDPNKPAPPPVARDEKPPPPLARESKPAPISTPARIPVNTPPPRTAPPGGSTRSPSLSDSSNGDSDVESLKAKVKKAEVDLKKADDIICSQEDEIKRLQDQIEALSRNRSASSDLSNPEPSPRNSLDGGSLSKSRGKQAAARVDSPAATAKRPPSAPTSSRSMTPVSGSSSTTVGVKHDELRKGNALNAFSDLSIILPTGTVTAHACLITARCSFLDKQLQERYGGKKKIPKKKEIQIKHQDIASFNRMVDYLYSDDDSFVTRCSTGDLFNIAITAKKFGVDKLLWICENFFVNGITLSNVVPLLKASTESKDERVKSFCVDFLLKPENFSAFVVRKDLTTELGMELFTEIVTMNTTALVNGRPASPTVGACPSSTFYQDMRSMYEVMQYHDAFVKIDNEVINFHKAVLAAASDKIFGAFTKAKFVAGQVDDVAECMLLSKDQKFHEKLSADAFKSMLKYIYYGETEIDPYAACQLIPVTRFYGLLDLQELCERRMRDAVTNSKVVMKILGTTYLPMMAGREEMRDKLRGDCIQHIVNHLKEVDFAAIKNMEPEHAIDSAMDIIHGCQKRYG